ncbi:hypothetical protein AB4Z09_28115 [Rhodococcus sp. TAF43]|uniref:hypothetical protein n=1 Tax=Rhodococcus sp. TAF43 TaxID=3237483 RepID=UPI003F991864
MNQGSTDRPDFSTDRETLLERLHFPLAFTAMAVGPLIIWGIARLVTDTLGL